MENFKRVSLPIFLFYLVLFLLSTISVESMTMKRSTYIIHVDKSHMPKVFTNYQNWYSSTIDSLKFLSPQQYSQPSLLYIYDNVFHGFSAVLTFDEVEALKKTPGFIFASRDKTHTLQTTHTPKFLSLGASVGLWNAANYGKDIIIGVIDSGVWPESPSFNDNGMSTKLPAKWKGSCEGRHDFNSSMCNSKIIGASFFNEALKEETNHRRGLLIIDTARDDTGHGTQVAAIAAGNYVDDVSYFGYAKGTASGIAPHARLAIYKVSWSNIAHTADIISGIEKAINDGVDVISLSLSLKEIPIYENAIAIASFSAMEKGILVVASAGNQGPALATVRNGFPWVLTVAASTIDRWFSGTVIFGNGLSIVGWSLFPGEFRLQDLRLVYNTALSSCTSLEGHVAPDGIILCKLGRLNDQIDSIVKSNTLGAILVFDDPIFSEKINFPCPCVLISSKEAEIAMEYVKSTTFPTVRLNFKQTFLERKPAPAVALYTSRGPSLSFPSILKPDVMAPGSLVLTASIPSKPASKIGLHRDLYSDYVISSGTSNACPHVAGVAALLKATHPEWSPAAILSAIVTTANTLDNTGNPIQDSAKNGQFASPFAMGAGQVNPNQALDPGLIYDATPQDYVNLLCHSRYSVQQLLMITKRTISCPERSSPHYNYPSFITFYNDNTTRVDCRFRRTVTNVGESRTTYEAFVVAPKGSTVVISPKTLVFQKKYEQHSYNLTVTYKGSSNWEAFFGALVWIDENRKYKVRSPIVISPTRF